MHYEQFSRQLREKYSTRFHRADQLVDRLKQKNQSAIAYLNENGKAAEPYLNECVLAAERMKNNRRSERDRQICYENLILLEKLERIKKQSGGNARENLEKDYQKHCRLLVSKANCEYDAIRSIHRKFTIKQSGLLNVINFNEGESSESSITSYHSPSLLRSESYSSSSENEDDQATAADVDVSMDYSDLTPPVLRQKRHHRHFNGRQSMLTKCKKIHSSKNQKPDIFEVENDRVYQHLTNIDMTMVRDTSPLPRTSQSSRHFSICILPRFDSAEIKSRNNQSTLRSSDRQYAFKKEILYH